MTTIAAITNLLPDLQIDLKATAIPALPIPHTATPSRLGATKGKPRQRHHRTGFGNGFDGGDIHTLLNDPLLDEQEILSAALTLVSEQQKRIKWLESLAVTDELTGLYNRRGFMSALAREQAACIRNPAAGGLLLLFDLDGFKSINDKYGHLVGDAYLRAVATCLRGLVRPSDLIARIGGDEFAVLLSRASATEGDMSAKRLAENLNCAVMRWDGQDLPIRACMGHAELTGGTTAEAIYAHADALLYAAKELHKRK